MKKINLTKKTKDNLFLIGIGVIFFYGSFLRFFQLGKQSYWMDEGYTINAVLSAVEKGKTILDSGKFYYCTTYCYPTAWITKIFGQNSFSYRLLPALAGIIFVFLLYKGTKDIFDKRVALMASFFAIFSYWQIAWSREARWYTLLELFFWASIYFFFKAYYSKRNNLFFWLMTVLFLILSIASQKISYLLPIIFLLFVICDAFVNKKNLRKVIAVVISSFLSIFLVFAFDKILNINFASKIIADFKFYNTFLPYSGFLIREYWFLIALSLIAIIFSPKNDRVKTLMISAPVIVYLLAYSFLTPIIHYRYLFHVTPALFVLSAYGLFIIYDKIKNNLAKASVVAIIALIYFLSKEGVLLPKNFYTLEGDRYTGNKAYYASTPQPNFNAAYEYVKTNRKTGDIVIASHPQFNKIFLKEPGYWIKYRYTGNDDISLFSRDDKEYYVGAKIIDDLSELKTILKSKHGYIILDKMSLSGRINPTISSYIRSNTKQVFFDEIGWYSKIWVYYF